MKKFLKIFIPIFIVFIFQVVLVVTNDINIKKYLVRIDDINIYINDELESLLEDDRYHGFYEGAKLYLLSYIDLEDKEYLTHCYFL